MGDMPGLRRSFEFPLLARELTESSAKLRTYQIRVGFAVLVSLLGVVTWEVLRYYAVRGRFSNLSVGPLVGHWIFYGQAVALDWLWPIVACSALTSEKERDTLSTLLLTRLSPAAIILEKFLSRMWLATSLLLTCLPLLALCFLQSNSPLEYFCTFPAVLFVSAAEITAISLMCSAYARSTAGALIGTYVCYNIARVATAILGVTIFLFLFPPAGPFDHVGYTIFCSLHLNPPDYRLYESVALPIYGIKLITFVTDVTNPAFWTVTLPISLGFYLPPVLVTLFSLWIAAFLLKRYRPAARQGTSLKAFVDRMGEVARRVNENPVTRGRVVFKEGRRLPDDDPVAWRETTTRALAQPRYLIGNLLVLEIPIIWFLLIASSRLSGMVMHATIAHMQTMLWIGMLLMVLVVVSGVIIQERQNQTLELLLTTPLSRREIVFQKRAGIERMLWIMQAPLWTCLAFRAAFGAPWPYLFNEAGMLVIYPRIVAWMAVDSSLRCKTRLAAIMDVLFGLTAWVMIGTLIGVVWCVFFWIFLIDLLFSGPDPAVGGLVLLASFQLSPATLLYLNSQFTDPLAANWPTFAMGLYVPGILNMAITLQALRWLKHRCLSHAEKYLRK